MFNEMTVKKNVIMTNEEDDSNGIMGNGGND